MYKIRLENTVTHQIYEQDVVDANNGDKLYFRFGVNTADLADGEYILTLFNENGDVLVEDILRIGDFNPETLQYSRGENTYISFELDAVLSEKSVVINEINTKITTDSGVDGLTAVYVDAQPVYDMGVNDQKSRLEPIKITENGTYSREDGYNEIEVEVPDLNGSYDEGYGDGYNTGYAEGEQVSYQNGYNDGYNTAGGEIAETAQVLNITENGVYATDFSKNEDYVVNGQPTGDNFYGYAELKDIVYDTKVIPNIDTKLELWYKGDNTNTNDGWNVVIGSDRDSKDNSFNLTYNASNNDKMRVRIGKSYLDFPIEDDSIWQHFVISREGVYVNGEYKGSIDVSNFAEQGSLYINASPYRTTTRKANGTFGMIKITTDGVENVIIPTNDGFLNTTTNEMLDIIVDGSYSYGNFLNKKSEEGNLIRTVNVNIQPKISIADENIKFGFSKITEIPQWANFKGVKDFSNMFINCLELRNIDNLYTSDGEDMAHMFDTCRMDKIEWFDTSKATNMSYMFSGNSRLKQVADLNTSNVVIMDHMFYNCPSLEQAPNIDTSNVTNMGFMFANTPLKTIPLLNTSKVTIMTNMFEGSMEIEEIPPIDTRNVTSMSNMFYAFSTEHKLRKLPEFDCTNVTNMASYFSYYQDKMPYFTDCGGWKNLKQKWDDNYGLRACANLTYESCINILNGLYDFVGNGEKPTSSQAKLKVNQNFLSLVGDQISIGTDKGWTITT